MNKKVTKAEIAKTFGYSWTTFRGWDKTDILKQRYEWLKTSTLLIRNGFKPYMVLNLADRNKQLEDEREILHEELSNLTDEVNGYKSKIEALNNAN